MAIIIFIVVLAVLILVHEFGHFIVAKKSGIKVTEFGLGFPPRLFGWKRGETEYTLNAIPFGGFVKIFGENPNEETENGPERERSFGSKPRSIQALVLVAGVLGNIIFAWLLLSLGYMLGLPAEISVEDAKTMPQSEIIVTNVLEGSPAAKSGIILGDSLLGVSGGVQELQKVFSTSDIYELVNSENGKPVKVSFRHGNDSKTVTVLPEKREQGDFAIGISTSLVGYEKLPVHKAFLQGAKFTYEMIRGTIVGLTGFIVGIFRTKPDFSQVTGPVGIVSLVGVAWRLGFSYLISFTALISINLAVINLVPFPALDGGRLLFVGIEALRRKAISRKIMNTVNMVGFALLLLLMAVVTVRDIFHLLW